MANWNNLHITDKTGRLFFKVTASELSTYSELNNLKRHLIQAKEYKGLYHFLDIDSAHIVVNGEPYKELTINDIDLDELLTD